MSKKDWVKIFIRLDPERDRELINIWKGLLLMCGSVPRAFRTLLREYTRGNK